MIGILIQILTFSIHLQHTLATSCPSLALISPCQCVQISSYSPNDDDGDSEPNNDNLKTFIECHSEGPVDLVAIFDKLSSHLPKEDLIFDKLVIKNPSLNELPMNLTRSVIFKRLVIDAPNIERIHSEAFVGTAEAIEIFELGSSMDKFEDQSSPYDFFDMINTMSNLVVFQVHSPNFDVIPYMAFDELPKLRHVEFDLGLDPSHQEEAEDKLYVIDNAFYSLPRVSTLILKRARIDMITTEMLGFQNPEPSVKDELLTVNLLSNNLTVSSFAIGCFEKFHRPTLLMVSYNPISKLDEAIFKPFLDANDQNKIQALGLPLECKNQDNSWWLSTQNGYVSRVEQDACVAT